MVGSTNTLKVIFPGVRYSIDRSCLYYLDRYIDGDSIYIEYDDKRYENKSYNFIDEINKDFEIAKQVLSNINFSKYGEIILIGKSIGTVVACLIRNYYMLDKARFICLTPINETLQYIRQTDFIITSKADKYINLETIEKERFKYPFLTIYSDLPHSLEYKNDFHKTLKVLENIIDLSLNYLDTSYKDLLG